MKGFLQAIDASLAPLRRIAESIGTPLLDLIMRLYIGCVFFSSGLLKFENFLNGDWESTVFLFDEVHPVPGLSPETAAIIGTGGELILPILLILGLFSRFAAAGLLIMTAIIEFTYQQSPTHILWAFLLANTFSRGGGKLSADHYLLNWLRK